MGFFSNRRNKIIEEEIVNALLYSEGFHDTSIYWEAFEKFAQEHGGRTDKHADGGQDTGFKMITNGTEVKVMAIRDRYDGTASIKVQTLADFEKEVDEFAADFAIKARGGIPKDEEIEDEYESDEDFLKRELAKFEDEDEDVEDEDEFEDILEDEFEEEEEVDFDVAEDSEVEEKDSFDVEKYLQGIIEIGGVAIALVPFKKFSDYLHEHGEQVHSQEGIAEGLLKIGNKMLRVEFKYGPDKDEPFNDLNDGETKITIFEN